MSGLLLRGVEAGYGGLPVISALDLAVPAGTAAAVLGVNGAGKTTLLRAISGLIAARGTISFDGTDLIGRAPEAIARQGIAHVPEGRGNFTGFSVEENLLIGAAAAPRDEIAERMATVFSLFPTLADRRRQIAGTMSGGEQQMLAIGRGLMMRPRLLMLDEPSFGLAPRIVAALVEALALVRARDGLSLLLVEQNLLALRGLVGEVHVLAGGRVVLSAPPEDPAVGEVLRAAYLGG
ncbi:MAG: ABC transporter ATP-binding protein [Bauldia sp.]|nr:ABC transporter ATP-binding protein [Bauldia sp.]MCW5719356.1 ABC transporter ATP-binding protein [Bauldia sp.]